MITMVTGGARSGKSTFAETHIATDGGSVLYIACGVVTDEEMQQRIDRHRAQRPSSWYTIERYSGFGELASIQEYIDSEHVLLDCITTMITNLMMDADVDYDTCTMDIADDVERHILQEIEALLDVYCDSDKHLVVVTNEVGLGLVPAYRMGRIFRDIHGRANQLIAGRADSVFNIISGIPQRIK